MISETAPKFFPRGVFAIRRLCLAFGPANQFAQFDVQSARHHEKGFNIGRAHFPFKVADALLGKTRADSKLGQGKFEFLSALLNHQGKSMAERRAFFL